MAIEEPFTTRRRREVVQKKQEDLIVSEYEDIDGIELRTQRRIEVSKEREQVVVDIKTEL